MVVGFANDITVMCVPPALNVCKVLGQIGPRVRLNLGAFRELVGTPSSRVCKSRETGECLINKNRFYIWNDFRNTIIKLEM